MVKKGQYGAYLYSLFIVAISPLSLPLAVYTYCAGLVHTPHILLFVSFSLLTQFGVTLGYHRYFTHQGFRTSLFIERLLLILGAMAFQGPPAAWASSHLTHHRYADTPEDPHSPLHGFWHSYCLWLFTNYRVRRLPGTRRIFANPTAKWIARHYGWITLFSLVLPYLAAGWVGFIWGGLLRIFTVSHAIFLANALLHLRGTQPNPQANESRNHWLPALLCLGEGWHNNHHAQPKVALHGWHWYQFDPTGYLIRLLEALGLIWSVRRPKRMEP